ncbi:acyl-coenzyme A thioesterase 9, mitochondrial isoform X2 [Rhineura floridana]|uniref:acyl-coenzyme A thioesterase 9, mitochondrial isoform X2 n=1 Tax=Rhineura floridana TaxID=261503 RepID=UPI002AC8539B|nr:acyl-coenzyme A thioesterase 9, mitochondrial isoform X2 [Rhineura floridana]
MWAKPVSPSEKLDSLGQSSWQGQVPVPGVAAGSRQDCSSSQAAEKAVSLVPEEGVVQPLQRRAKCYPAEKRGGDSLELAQQWFSFSKTCPVLTRTLTSSVSGSQASQHMEEVRSRLREIVGASTNWRDHVQAMNERKALHTLLAKSQADLPSRKMRDSYIEVILPLGSQPEIREKYLNVHNSVRFGRILEDLDSLGVLICYTHTKHEAAQKSPLSIVTALVDKIGLWKQDIRPDSDIKFVGNVSWVGKTSMEVKMHMLQFHEGVYCPVLDATFVMVARDPENKRPAFVNPLLLESPEEEKIFKEGEMNKTRRIDSSKASLLKMAPTAEERNIVHDIFLDTLDTRTMSFRSRVLPPNSVWMQDAALKGLEICHPQERNIFNRIFGGFLMRKAYELGWVCAYSYGNSRPYVVAVDDIMFQKPVEIGSLLLLSSQVCYTEKNNIQVRVHSEVYDPDTRVHHTTNVFHFTFMLEKEIPNIVPKTYGESMLYLDGKRHFDSAMKDNTAP